MEMFYSEVCKKLDYYVYRLIDPRNGETFYIGMGKNNRVFDHMRMELKFDKSSHENNEDEVTEKFKILREIRNEGLDPIHIIHRHGMNKEEAFEVEAALIDAFSGLTNIVSGHGSNEFGPANAIQLIKKYEATEMEIPNDHKILAINVNQTASHFELIDAVRYAWRIDISKAKKADYIFAIKQGICIGVFVAKEWLHATQENFRGFPEADPKRYGFNGDIAHKVIRDMYVGKRLPKNMQRKKGMSNPIQYKNL